jgi:hypothetical protein
MDGGAGAGAVTRGSVRGSAGAGAGGSARDGVVGGNGVGGGGGSVTTDGAVAGGGAVADVLGGVAANGGGVDAGGIVDGGSDDLAVSVGEVVLGGVGARNTTSTHTPANPIANAAPPNLSSVPSDGPLRGFVRG